MEELSERELKEIRVRAEAAQRVVASPWTPLRATKDNIGGESFVQGGHPDLDQEIYINVLIDGQRLDSFSDPRVDDIIDFLGNAPGDIQHLLNEVRRLRQRSSD